MRLNEISLLRQRVTEWNDYPFNIPAIASLTPLRSAAECVSSWAKTGPENPRYWKRPRLTMDSDLKAVIEISHRTQPRV